MSNTKCVWGGVMGKVVAAMLVLGIVCGAMFASLHYAFNAETLLSVDEVTTSSSSDRGNNTLNVKLHVKKNGFYLAKVKTEKDGDKLYVEFYASLEKNKKYTADSQGYYNITLPFDADTLSIVQKGADDSEVTIITLNHKS